MAAMRPAKTSASRDRPGRAAPGALPPAHPARRALPSLPAAGINCRSTVGKWK